MAAPKKVDYDRIEPGWRAGIASPRQLAAQYTEETGQAISHAAISNHFKKQGIPRDLGSKIRSKADAMVTEAMVTGKVTPKPSIPEKQIIEDGAMAMAAIRMAHRADIQRGRDLFGALLAEVEQQTGSIELYERLGELLDDPEVTKDGRVIPDKLNEIYRKVISTPGRVDSAKKLVETLEKLVRLERQAFNLDDEKPSEDDPLTKLLHSIAGGNGSSLKPVAVDPEHEE